MHRLTGTLTGQGAGSGVGGEGTFVGQVGVLLCSPPVPVPDPAQESQTRQSPEHSTGQERAAGRTQAELSRVRDGRLVATKRGSGQVRPAQAKARVLPTPWSQVDPNLLHHVGPAPAKGLGFPFVTTMTLDAIPTSGSVAVPDTLSLGPGGGGSPAPHIHSAGSRSHAGCMLRANKSLTLAVRVNVLCGNVVYGQSRAINYLMSRLPIS